MFDEDENLQISRNEFLLVGDLNYFGIENASIVVREIT